MAGSKKKVIIFAAVFLVLLLIIAPVAAYFIANSQAKSNVAQFTKDFKEICDIKYGSVSYNILNRFIGSYSDPSYSFYITPAIRYVISSEKMNALYSSITKRDEDDITILDEKRDSTSIFDSKSEEEK